jgi:NTP pyrophosphatase (non-canonical NTP hydrolase)
MPFDVPPPPDQITRTTAIPPPPTPLAICHTMGQLLHGLVQTADLLHLDLSAAIHDKMKLNARKYPVALCQGKAGKYTQYSAVTGITKHQGQSTMQQQQHSESTTQTMLSPTISDGHERSDPASLFWTLVPTLTITIREFATARQWSRFHTPRSLLLALLGELGELAELVQWAGDIDNDDDLATTSTTMTTTTTTTTKITATQRDKLRQELADVTIYLLRLADVCHVDWIEVYHSEWKKATDSDELQHHPTASGL